MIQVALSKDKKQLIITADIETPVASKSGKTLVIASTRGNMRTEVQVAGKPVTIGLNAYVPAGIIDAPPPAAK